MSNSIKKISLVLLIAFCGFLIAQSAGAVNIGEIENPINYNNVDEVLSSILNYLRSVVGGLAVAFIIIGGVVYILSSGNQQRAETGKKIITVSVLGLAIILAAPSFLKEISKILDWTESNPDVQKSPTLAKIALSVLNFLLGVIGGLALIFLIIGGIMYLTSAGTQSRAETGKKIVTYAIIGIAVALAAIVIVKQIASLISG